MCEGEKGEPSSKVAEEKRHFSQLPVKFGRCSLREIPGLAVTHCNMTDQKQPRGAGWEMSKPLNLRLISTCEDMVSLLHPTMSRLYCYLTGMVNLALRSIRETCAALDNSSS